MAISEKEAELIDKHLVGSLSAEEKRTFDALKSSDPEFREELMKQEHVVLALRAQERAVLKVELSRMVGEEASAPELHVAVDNRKKNRWIWAAAVAAVLVASPFLLRNINQADTTQLYTLYYEPFSTTPTDPEENTLESARELYQQQAFRQAIPLFLEAIQEEKASVDHLYLGNCYLEIKDYRAAKRTFEEAQSNGDTIIAQHATWYLALIALKKGAKREAIRAFTAISKTPGPYRERAKAVVKDLK